MSEQERRERDYGDRAAREEAEAYEPVYRDGTAKNECWASAGYTGHRAPGLSTERGGADDGPAVRP